MEFRDVFEVDGSPIRERDQRLVKMFLRAVAVDQPSRSARSSTESARYNIGDIQRNVNTPIFPLLFLESANHFRFKFKRAERSNADDARGGRDHAWTARFGSRPTSGWSTTRKRLRTR